jgi:hypothetical protein
VSKLDQLRALGEARRQKSAARPASISNNAGGKHEPRLSTSTLGLTGAKMPADKIGKAAVRSGISAPGVSGPEGESVGATNSKRGRPLAKDAHKTLSATKPWEAEGISRRTWYRNRSK